MTLAGSGYVGRFAPSPTGPLHFGSLVAAVASFIQAVAANGDWYVRIDDIDPPRQVDGSIENILHLLDSYGFFRRDNGCQALINRESSLSTNTTCIVLQSNSESRYQLNLDKLLAENKAYACACSRKQLAGEPVYPGICRHKGLALSGNAIRFNVAGTAPANALGNVVSFTDVLGGEYSQNVVTRVGDFVIKRRDGLWSYQLASVVDDAHDGVTEVVRGADLLDNTPRQITLLEALGWRAPDYLHIPLAIDENGKKLSKQTLAKPVDVAKPLPALFDAWEFLGQEMPIKCETVAHFWEHAELSWRLERVPLTGAFKQPAHSRETRQ